MTLGRPLANTRRLRARRPRRADAGGGAGRAAGGRRRRGRALPRTGPSRPRSRSWPSRSATGSPTVPGDGSAGARTGRWKRCPCPTAVTTCDRVRAALDRRRGPRQPLGEVAEPGGDHRARLRDQLLGHQRLGGQHQRGHRRGVLDA